MENNPYYLFDPIQFEEFGYLNIPKDQTKNRPQSYFFKGDDFYFRYQSSKKFFYKNIYIPFGPNCKTKKGFENFLDHIEKTKFSKVTIDLPMIYSKKITQEVVLKLENLGFKKKPYILQDEETLVLSKNTFNLDSKRMNKVRHGYKSVDVAVKDKLNERELQEVYDIYLISSKRIGFTPKTKGMFVKLCENCLVSLAINKETKKIEGYVFGYFFTADVSEKNAKVLLIMFTGLSDLGRENKIGHAIHYDLFKSAFENYKTDIIDFHGASRTKNRTYLFFKQDFSEKYLSLPGSFQKIYL